MREKQPSCSESATLRIVPRSTGVIGLDSALRFVLAPGGIINLIAQLGSTWPFNGGLTAIFLFVTADQIVIATIVVAAWTP